MIKTDMKLAPIFCDHTVLQANKPIRIYGEGQGTAQISFDGESHSVCSCEDFWCLEFAPRPYGGPYTLTATLNGETSVYSDIYVGEVILLAGQSNIAMKLDKTAFPKEKIEDNPAVRYFAAARFGTEDATTPADGWISCTKERAGRFSAIGYHVGMDLSREKNIAVGLIACYLGASVIESWIPAEIGNREEFYLPPEEKYDSPFVHAEHNEYGRLYGIRQQSIVPFSLGRVIWYQGESNTGRGEYKNYTKLLSELINCWRKDFLDPALHFYVVQIADFDERNDAAWRGIQTAQEKIVDFVDHVSVIRSADVCETFDIHPPTKIRLADRIWEKIKARMGSDGTE